MKFLITGITGFTGPHLANLLISKDHEVYGLIRQSNGMETDILDIVPAVNFAKIKFLYGDLLNQKSMDKIIKANQFDGIFHLAAQSHPSIAFSDTIDTLNINIMGSANLIEAVSEYSPNTKFMFCSSSEVYGNMGDENHVLTTNTKMSPSNPYGVSKAAIDLFMQERIINGKIKGFITRAFSHTGPRRGKTFSISSDAYQIAQMIKGYQGKTLRIGNLQTTRVVIDVRDCVNAYYLAMIHPDSNGKILNVCGNTPHKMEFYTNLLIDLSNLKDIKKVIDPKLYRPIDINYQSGDSSELIKLTNWSTQFSIEQTLEDLLYYWVNKL